MTLTRSETAGIARHIGYGNPNAALWFVGSEEGLGGKMSAEEQAENLRARSNWRPIMDIAEAHATLREQGRYITDLINRPGSTQVWRYMARFARALAGKPDYLDSKSAADYVRNSLGRDGRETFLTELEPFPAARARRPAELKDFPDESLLQEVRRKRKNQQLDLLHSAKPRVVICYGIRLGPLFAEHFGLRWRVLDSFGWVSGKSGAAREKAIYEAELPSERERQTKAFLLPFFGQGQLPAEVLRRFIESEEFQRCRG